MEIGWCDCSGKTLPTCPAFIPFSTGFSSVQTFRQRAGTTLAREQYTAGELKLPKDPFIYWWVNSQIWGAFPGRINPTYSQHQ